MAKISKKPMKRKDSRLFAEHARGEDHRPHKLTLRSPNPVRKTTPTHPPSGVIQRCWPARAWYRLKSTSFLC